jgi:serine/threonine-protein kinase
VSNRLAILLAGETRQRLLTSGTDARYLPTGHLVFWRDGSLWAAPFDLSRLVLDEGVPVVEGVAVRGSGNAAFAVAANGTLAYIEASRLPERTLVWVNRNGSETPLGARAGPYTAPRLSPDDSKVILSYRTGATEDIWLHDIARGMTEPFMAEPASEWLGTWAPDGDRVLFTSRRAGPFHLYSKRANGLGDIELVVEHVARPFGRTPDGRGVLLQGANASIALLTIADRTTKPLWSEAGVIGDARLSPDGRWIAYETGASGAREQVWVRPYPDVDSNRWRISPDGGQFPRWSADGRTIFFQRGTAMMAVNVRTGPPFSYDPPVKLFEGAYAPGYDLARDGRFLMIKEATPPAAAHRIVVVLNWVQEMSERLARR